VKLPHLFFFFNLDRPLLPNTSRCHNVINYHAPIAILSKQLSAGTKIPAFLESMQVFPRKKKEEESLQGSSLALFIINVSVKPKPAHRMVVHPSSFFP